MLIFKNGNIFNSEAKFLVNPVNCVGIMGKGLALQFKKRYKKNFDVYVNKCINKEFDVGTELIVVEESEKTIINFPTKKHWINKSELDYIIIGLSRLKEIIIKYNIKSIAIPALGVGNGGLEWKNVKALLIKFYHDLIQSINFEIKVEVYSPH